LDFDHLEHLLSTKDELAQHLRAGQLVRDGHQDPEREKGFRKEKKKK
jgi:hypothetical protein